MKRRVSESVSERVNETDDDKEWKNENTNSFLQNGMIKICIFVPFVVGTIHKLIVIVHICI